jgi:uroporphyrinogen-III synthase
MHILVTRPEPDALRLKGHLEARGHTATLEPLLSVSFEDCDPIDLEGVTALIATSRYGLLALDRYPEVRRQAAELTVFTVGAATARLARQMGFGTVVTGPGTAQTLVTMIVSALDPSESVLLHLAGERLATDIASELEAHGFRATAATVYRMVHRASLTDATRDLIADGEIEAVLLMSPETASIWSRLVQRHRLQEHCREIYLLCLSVTVARRLASLGSIPVETAGEPTLEEVLALVDMVDAKLAL